MNVLCPVAFLAIVGWLVSASPAAASRRPVFRLIKAIELPNIGLKITVMPDVRESPMPPPTVFTYQFK